MSGSVLTTAADELAAALVRDAFLVVAIDLFRFDLPFLILKRGENVDTQIVQTSHRERLLTLAANLRFLDVPLFLPRAMEAVAMNSVTTIVTSTRRPL